MDKPADIKTAADSVKKKEDGNSELVAVNPKGFRLGKMNINTKSRITENVKGFFL